MADSADSKLVVTVNGDETISIRSGDEALCVLTAPEAHHLARLLDNAADEAERGKITDRTRAWYHGVWNRCGHYMHHVGGRWADANDCPVYDMGGLDGGWAPRQLGVDIYFVRQLKSAEERRSHAYRGNELPQGQFLLHRFPALNVSMLAWWDRTHGDKRGGCNSVYIVEGEPSVNDMLAWWPRHFPLQAKHLAEAGVNLVQVYGSTD